MSCSQQLVFLKEWSFYLKGGQLRCVNSVLMRTPANPSQLAFQLEVAAQLSMLKSLGVPHSRQISGTGQPKLPNFHSFSQHLLTQDYVRNLVSIHGKIKYHLVDHDLYSILIKVLSDSYGLEIEDTGKKSYQCLKSIGKLCYLLTDDSNLSQGNMLKEMKDRWSVRKLIGKEWRDSLVNLLILWSANQAKEKWMGDVKVKIQDEASKLMSEWLESMAYLLANRSIIGQFSEEDLLKVGQQSKSMAKALKLKPNKNKREIILQIKKKMLEKCTSGMQQMKNIAFGYYFTIINAICSEVDEKLETIITLQDVINNEGLLYSSFWGLSKGDVLKYFPSFYNFMRNNSQQSILSIYQKINSNFSLPDALPVMTKDTMACAVVYKSNSIFQQFNLQPITTSRILLQNYLQWSGVPLPKYQRDYNKRQRQIRITPIVADPMHFMMVSKKYWQDDFHRDLLEIALWISLDAYCKWIERQSLRDIQEKEVQQYIKKLNIAVAIFFFSLDHPTHLLQYQPVESDCLKELFVQAIFPSLILNCKYFFAAYNWQTRKIINKLDNGLENWVLPWAHLLNNPKNMLNFIYFERGYELAHKIATQNRTNFDRIFGDFFNTRILTELQGFGINLTNGEVEIKQKLSFLNPQRKKYMIMLLRQSEKGGQKVSHTARRILQILV